MTKKPFTVKHHGDNPIDLKFLGASFQVRPTQLHMNNNGAIDDTPTFAFVSEHPQSSPMVGQISMNMLNEGLNELGYKIVKL